MEIQPTGPGEWIGPKTLLIPWRQLVSRQMPKEMPLLFSDTGRASPHRKTCRAGLHRETVPGTRVCEPPPITVLGLLEAVLQLTVLTFLSSPNQSDSATRDAAVPALWETLFAESQTTASAPIDLFLVPSAYTIFVGSSVKLQTIHWSLELHTVSGAGTSTT